MPAKRSFFTKVNLIPQDEFERSFLGKALSWSLTAGKSIVILTEFVVILAFLSRFKLDRDLNDLNEVLIQKQAVVDSYAEIETRMRAIQARLDVVQEIDKSTLDAEGVLTDLIASTPLDVEYESVNLSNTNIALIGVAGSEAGFSALLNKVRESGKWTQVSLGDVEFSQRRGGVVFTINAQKAATAGGEKK